MADDLGYADLSCYGRTEYRTPHIDSLAADGMRFAHGYSNSAVCSATRTGLITGCYQDRFELGLEQPLADRDVGLPPDQPTLPSVLRDAGYATTLIGKWHLGRLPNFGPEKSGYDYFYGIRGGGGDYFLHDNGLWRGDTLAHQTGYLTELLGNEAVDVIARSAKSAKPFFVSLHFTAPHFPWLGPDDEAEGRRLAGEGGAGFHFTGGSMKTYASMVKSLDDQVGRVLQALKKSGRASNTIVVFTSDNGGERFSKNWPFSGRKGELLEGGIRVPTIVRWPKQTKRGTESAQTVMSMDWLPTFAAAAGAPSDPRYPTDGMNLLDTLRGVVPPVPRKLFWRYNSLAQEAMRDGDWKYLKIRGNTFLFNVVEDPQERANQKTRFPALFERMATEWQEWNKTLLPYSDENYTNTLTGEDSADHFGIHVTDTTALDIALPQRR
jgi:arylsulfatase A-like enzyme